MLRFPFISQIRNLPGKAVPFVGSTARLFELQPSLPRFFRHGFGNSHRRLVEFVDFSGPVEDSIYRRHSSEPSRDIPGKGLGNVRNDYAKWMFPEGIEMIEIVDVIDAPLGWSFPFRSDNCSVVRTYSTFLFWIVERLYFVEII